MTRVLATGVFDLLHAGHLHYLNEAKKLGDELVVIVATDATVRRRKHEPVTPEALRLELIQALKPVDRAIIGHEGDIFEVVRDIGPDVIALGYDQEFDERELQNEIDRRGIRAKVIRLSKYADDLNGTRKIIRKIIDWYTFKKTIDKAEGDR